MCSVIISRQPGAPWPVIIGANRDEMQGRPWMPPDRHWPDRPNVVAGLDELAGGSWMGVNDEGVVAVVLNRFGTLGPEDGKRSRGELVLDALDHADAADAADALAHLDCRAYRSFNLLVADNRDAFVIINRGADVHQQPDVVRVPDGIHMLTASDMDDLSDWRQSLHLPRFRAAGHPDPALVADPAFPLAGWQDWPALLASGDFAENVRGEAGAMTFHLPSGFGTVSSALLALPAPEQSGVKPRWLFKPALARADNWRPVDAIAG